MPTTTDGFATRDNSMAFDPYAGDTELATSLQLWADKRKIPTYYWADTTARNAQAGMVAGSEGYQVDNAITYKYDGSAWKAWHTIKPVAFTPTWNGLTVGNSTQQARYTIAAGTVQVRGFITIGTTGSVGAGPYMTAPVPLNGYATGAPNNGTDQALGQCTLVDTGTQGYPGIANAFFTGGVIYIRPQAIGAGLAYATSNLLASTVPFTFGTGDYISYNYSYQAD